jgi:hypothetical protein
VSRRGSGPPIRRTAAGIEVMLPTWVLSLVLDSVRRLRHQLETPGSPATGRLLSPLDETATADDPIVTLMRQHALDEVFDTVESSAQRGVLSDPEAEMWLEALGLVLAARTAELGIHTEVDRRGVGRRDEAFLRVVYAVQLGLIDALDTTPPMAPPAP